MGFSIQKTDDSVELGNEEVFVSFARSDFEEMIRAVYKPSELFDLVPADPYRSAFADIYDRLGRLEFRVGAIDENRTEHI